MKRTILIAIGLIITLTGCSQHHIVERQTVVPVATVQKPMVMPMVNTQVPMPMMQQGAVPQQYPQYAPQQMPQYGAYKQQGIQRPMPTPRANAQVRQAPKGGCINCDVNYDMNKIYSHDFPVTYRKKKCTNCN